MTDDLVSIIADALGCPASELSQSSGLGRHPMWDSLGHVTIMSALEAAVGLHVTPENIGELLTIEKIAAHLRSHPGARDE